MPMARIAVAAHCVKQPSSLGKVAIAEELLQAVLPGSVMGRFA
jgi:hypothetical protein